VQDAHAQMLRAGAKEDDARVLALQMADHLVAQDYEAAGRSLGDHGVFHIAQDAALAREIMEAQRGGPISAREAALLALAATYHDAGYLTEPSRMFLDNRHAAWSEQHFDANVRASVEASFGKEFADQAAALIRDHESTDIDWDRDPVRSAFATADNLALFHAEKMPPFARYVPTNVGVLVAMARGHMSLADARAAMHANIAKNTGLSRSLRTQMHNAVTELSPALPKYMLGMLGTKLEGVKWSGDHPVFSIRRGPSNDALSKVLDLGQQQFFKLASTYKADPNAFAKPGRVRVRRGERTIFEADIHAWHKRLAQLLRAIGLTAAHVASLWPLAAKGDWDPDKHPRVPAGSGEESGQFTSGGGGDGGGQERPAAGRSGRTRTRVGRNWTPLSANTLSVAGVPNKPFDGSTRDVRDLSPERLVEYTRQFDRLDDALERALADGKVSDEQFDAARRALSYARYGLYPSGDVSIGLVAVDKGGSVRGGAMVTPHYLEGVAKLDWLGSFQRGAGSALLREAEEIARAEGCDYLALESTTYARPFYEKHGYERYEQHGFDFRKDLSKSKALVKQDDATEDDEPVGVLALGAEFEARHADEQRDEPSKSTRAKYSDDQPRDENGRWTDSGGGDAGGDAGEPSGIEMVSPNVRENLDFEQAHAAMGSARQRAVMAVAHEVDDIVGLDTTQHEALGAWKDGAENSILVQVRSPASYDEIAVSAAMKGMLADQKAVIPFRVEKGGPDTMYRMDVEGDESDLRRVHDELEHIGIENHTLEVTGAGLRVWVFDQGTAMRDTMQRAGETYGVKVAAWKGRGEFLGGDTRAEGRAAYDRIIRRVLGHDGQRRWEGLYRRWRETHPEVKAQALTKYSDDQPRDENGRWTDAGGGGGGGGSGGGNETPRSPAFTGTDNPNAPLPTEPFDRHYAVREVAYNELGRLGMGSECLYVDSAEPPMFAVGEHVYREGGHYDRSDGRITIYSQNEGPKNVSAIEMMVRHEASHLRFDAANKALKGAVREYVAKNVDALAKEDGHEAYSKSYWAVYEKRKRDRDIYDALTADQRGSRLKPSAEQVLDAAYRATNESLAQMHEFYKPDYIRDRIAAYGPLEKMVADGYRKARGRV
jgi:GNAT superfamily N-acetyltransferase